MTARAGAAERFRVARREIRLALRDTAIALRVCRRPVHVALGRLTGRSPLTVVLRDGTQLTGPDGKSLLPLVHEVFEQREYDRFGDVVRPGDVVVDIGAHVGAFSVLAGRRGAARIIAYEPSPENVTMLRANLEANDVAATVHHAAVGSANGTVRLLQRERSVGHRVAEDTRGVSDRERGVGEVSVRCTSLEGVLEENGLEHADVLKMDCEGAEGAILLNAPDQVMERFDTIVMEYHDDWSILSATELRDLLVRTGFAVQIAGTGDTRFGMIHARRIHRNPDE